MFVSGGAIIDRRPRWTQSRPRKLRVSPSPWHSQRN